MCVLTLKSSHRPDGKIADVLALMGCSRVSHFVLAGWRRLCPEWHGELLIVHHHRQHSYLCACSSSKLPIAPMGKLLTGLPRFSLAHLRLTFLSTTGGTCCRDLKLLHRLKVPIAPMGKCLAPMGFSHVLHLCLQGGGVLINGGTVSFSSCTITGNTASSVRAHMFKISHRPHRTPC